SRTRADLRMLIAIALLHTIAGYLLFALASDEETQETCFYTGRNPFVGDIYKYTVYAACWSLIACAPLLALAPKLAITAAWASIFLYLFTGILDPIAERRWPTFCRGCAISIGVRVLAALTFTWLAVP